MKGHGQAFILEFDSGHSSKSLIEISQEIFQMTSGFDDHRVNPRSTVPGDFQSMISGKYRFLGYCHPGRQV